MILPPACRQRSSLNILMLTLLLVRIPATVTAEENEQAGQQILRMASEDLPPFPENRVRDFYLRQARRILDQTTPWPELIPEFPGLDGGSFGHWGQNPEADNYDRALNDVQLDGLLSQVTRHFGRTTYKAVNIRLGIAGEFSATFDPETLRYADVWKGGFVQWQPARFGITSGVDAIGTQLPQMHDPGWTLPAGTETRYLGFFRNGPHVVFHYRIGTAIVFDHLLAADGGVHRTLTVEGDFPPGVAVGQGIPTQIDNGATKRLVARCGCSLATPNSEHAGTAE